MKKLKKEEKKLKLKKIKKNKNKINNKTINKIIEKIQIKNYKIKNTLINLKTKIKSICDEIKDCDIDKIAELLIKKGRKSISKYTSNNFK